MSLYTPVFPSFHEPNASRKGHPENLLAAPPGKQQNYVEFLRDVHLFLSTQSDMLSPPSRPNSPLFDYRVQKVRGEIKNIINATEDETSGGKWTRVNQSLKLGCVRGRHWSVSGDDLCAPEENTNWILPDEESEWIEWEKKREESRRLKGKTNVSQQIDTAASIPPGSQEYGQAIFTNHPTRAYNAARERPPRGVSPTTLRAAKEKVRKWQASMTANVRHNTANGSSSASSSTGAVVAATAAKGKSERPQRSHTLDFAVIKPAARSIIEKRGKGSLSRPGVRGGSAPVLSHEFKPSLLSKTVNVPEVTAPVSVDKTGSKQPLEASSVKDGIPKIADVSEAPYLPPSFPAHLETSTPLPGSAIIVRAKPSPILPLPALSPTPQLSTSANLPDECQLITTKPHATSSSLPPQLSQIDAGESGKRSRAMSISMDSISSDPLTTPPAKRLRTPSQNHFISSHSKPISPNGDLDAVDYVGNEVRGPSSAASRRETMDTVGMASGAPSTPVKNDQPPTSAEAQNLPEKVPSPTKSVKSYFSAPDSDPDDSPLKGNLLLESPVSPMLSYAQNPSGFLPQITSTQVGKGLPTASRTNHDMLGMGYSSQFDVERHVDRVSEMLEKDVDFDGWLRDVRTVETSQD